jgi:hypothetical protein
MGESIDYGRSSGFWEFPNHVIYERTQTICNVFKWFKKL